MPAFAQPLVILVALIAFWAIVMRPARNQQKQVARFQEGLAVGDEVVLSAGIFGTIQALEGARVLVEIAPGTTITVARQVVVRRAEEIAGPEDHVTEAPAPDASARQDGHLEGDRKAED